MHLCEAAEHPAIANRASGPADANPAIDRQRGKGMSQFLADCPSLAAARARSPSLCCTGAVVVWSLFAERGAIGHVRVTCVVAGVSLSAGDGRRVEVAHWP